MNNQNINPKSLKGKDVFNRTLELMNKLTPLNESVINASLEFIKRAPNGLVYTIIRENHKYFIKTSDKLEFKISELDYIGGLKNKMTEAYSSYEEALKHLNMKFQEINERHGIKQGYNLFEQDVFEAEDSSNEETGVKEKKYKLKVPSDSTSSSEEMPMPSGQETPTPTNDMEVPSVEDVPASPEGEGAPDMSPEAPEGEEVPEAPEGEEVPEAPEGEVDTEEEDLDDIDIDEDEDPKKYIQKLTGRLGQKLRELSEVDPKLEKYVINSIISALHIDKMDKKDRLDVIKKFKKKKGMESIMKESFGMDEYYGMMSLEGPFNYEKIKGGYDENMIDHHPKKHKPLRFKKYELDMDEKLHGNQHKLDKNKNGRLDAEDFRMLRSNKDENMDEKLYGNQHKLDKNRNGRLDGEDFEMLRSGKNKNDRSSKLKNALMRIKRKRAADERFKDYDDIKFYSAKDEMMDMDEMDISELLNANPYVIEPDIDIDTEELPVRIKDPFDDDDDTSIMPDPKMRRGSFGADPDIEIDEPLVEPTPRVPDPFDDDDDVVLPMPGPKMGRREKEMTFESIIKKYRLKK